MRARVHTAVCNVGVLWLNAQTARVGFGVSGHVAHTTATSY